MKLPLNVEADFISLSFCFHFSYFDVVTYTFLVIDTVILFITSFPVKSPFVGDLPPDVITLFTIVFGIRIFLLYRDLVILKNSRAKIMTVAIHFVFLIVVGTAMISEMTGVMAMIVILCDGDIVFVNTGKLLRHLGYKHSRCYRATIYLGCYASVIFRAVIPTALIAMSLVNDSLFNMNRNAIVVFFVALVFYGTINTWHLNSTVARVCKKKARVIEVPYANFVQQVDDSLKESENEIPPSYQDACQTTVPTISGASVEATGGQENYYQGAGGGAEGRTEPGDGNVDFARIILNGSEDSYQIGAISHA